tara:strand:+ start:336 stop:629 length:294 start_codon:yes stop_codon:yes gene_type:complete
MADKPSYRLICYDIRSPKRLVKVHKVACGYAMPLQLSVFFGELTQGDVDALCAELSEIIDPKKDDVRIYGVTSIEKAVLLGTPRLPKAAYEKVKLLL